MNILSVNNLSKIGRERPLFTGVTFGLNEGDKAALIGRNGTGKSTLLQTIAGKLQPDEGSVVLNKSLAPIQSQESSVISYLPQNPEFLPEDTIRSHIFRSQSPKLQTIRAYLDVCGKMEGGITPALQKEFDSLSLLMENGNLWNYESQVRSILSTLGIHDLERKMSELSGGMIKKVALAQVLVEDSPLLLLDEPTNHLDISTIYWLQNHLAQTSRAVLMVTHDRYFLDAVCTNIYELARNRLKLYTGNYATYLEKKESEAVVEANTERRIESVLRVERDWLMRGPCARGTKAKARIQHDMALINREKFQADKGFSFEVAGRRLGGKVLELHKICKDFPKGFADQTSAPVLKDFSYKFTKGQKIGIFGDNGSGKSTLLNIITGELKPDSGSVEYGENTVFAYYRQNIDFKDTSLSVLEYAKEAAEIVRMNSGVTLSTSQFLEQFGFEGKILHSPVSTLSGGERKKLFLVRLLLTTPNFLILDEPTNDFDIFTMNILENFLSSFTGCLLIVSHDRYFMDKTADSLFILEDDGSVSGYVGKCSEYLQYRDMKKVEEESAAKKEREKKNQETEKAAARNERPKKLSFKEQKELEALETEIADLEEKQKSLEEDMSSADYAKSSAAGTEYKKISARLETAYARWEELSSLV
ncbi:MAG: ATP-binding cassette domain-containing protein [Treponema sp.]|nr:ATP-binding cassette domain-containing protein [Treponema sp.]